MNTHYVTAPDGAKIAYQLCGEGPALFLVHGAGTAGKVIWDKLGWVSILAPHFTLIIPDLRGYGESDSSLDPDFYTISNILADFQAIMNDCGFAEYSYLGHSYGATIGIQLCKNFTNIKKAVCAGSYFGDDFFKIGVPAWIKNYEDLNYKKKNNQLDDLAPGYREWVIQTDLDLNIAQFKAWNSWPGIIPAEVHTPIALYGGTQDYEDVLNHIMEQTSEIKQNGHIVKIFDDLDHQELISSTDIVIPWILEFLQN